MRINEDFLDDEQQEVLQQTSDVSVEETRDSDFYFMVELYPDKEEQGYKFMRRLLYALNVFGEIEIVSNAFEKNRAVIVIGFNIIKRFRRPAKCFDFLHRVICSVNRSGSLFGFAKESPKYAIRNSINDLVLFFTNDTLMLSDGFERAYDWLRCVIRDLMGSDYPEKFISRDILLQSGEMDVITDNICKNYSFSKNASEIKLDELEGHLLDIDMLEHLGKKATSYIIAVSDRQITGVHFSGSNAMQASEDYRKVLMRDLYEPKVMSPSFICSGKGSPQQRNYTFVCYIGSVNSRLERKSATHVFLVLKSLYVSTLEMNPAALDNFIKAMKYILYGDLSDEVIKKI